MNTKTTISITEARKRLFDILEEVQSPNKVYTFTEKGKPRGVLMSAEEYESMIETREVEQIFPNLRKQIVKARADIKSKNFKNYVTLEQVKQELGFVADKPKKKYAVPARNTKTHTKKHR